MKLPFFREKSSSDELNIFSDSLIEDTAQMVTNWQEAVVTNLPAPQFDPVRKARFSQIALVSLEDSSQLPALLEDASQSKLIQRICLPRNPRIAENELYELEGMDYIIMLTGQRINKDMVRWMKRLKQLKIPMLVLLTYEIEKRREQHQVDLFSQRIGIPFISIAGDDVEASRERFLLATLQHMPAMSLALAAHLPSFRDPLTNNLLDNASSDSLIVDPVDGIQLQLVRQVCAAHGFNEREFEKHQISMETLIQTTAEFATKLVRLFPMLSKSRRTRFANAVSTLLVGHATTMYLGAVSPSLRKVLIPKIWRLYRASRRAIPA